jgi:hypothetical protein
VKRCLAPKSPLICIVVNWARWAKPLWAVTACRPVYILERERGHIRSMWSRVTCLSLSLAAVQSLERRAFEDSQNCWRLLTMIENKQCKQNK